MGLRFQRDKCIGCKLCQLACSATNEEVFNPLLTRLSVESYYQEKALIIEAKVCTLCGQCADACPTSAISMERDRLIFNKEECINCGICTDVCPEKVIVQKEDCVGVCTLCEGDPWCVKSCPHGALTYEEALASEEAI